MNSNRVKRMTGLLLMSALLAFGLAACGGDEPVAVTPPPAPPPAPPPFQPEAVEVALGASGQSITLMTTEADDVFKLNGEDKSGSFPYTAGNNNYTVTFSDGTWTATFAPVVQEGVLLGASDQSITVTQTEFDGYEIDGTAVEDGGTHTAGVNNYTLTMEDGVWTATFAPMMMPVMLGNSGESVTIVQLEAGGYSLDGKMITADTTHELTNGATYGIAPGADGPMVVYLPDMVTVLLGELGGELALTLAEDRMTYMRDDVVFNSGTEVIGEGGRKYSVTIGDGDPMAEFIKPMPVVNLGDSDMTVTLIKDEAGVWSLSDDTAIETGYIYTGDGVNNYSLKLSADDMTWTATFEPKTMEVMLGTGVNMGETIMVTQVEAGGYVYNEMMVGDGAYAMAMNGARYSLEMRRRDDHGIVRPRTGQRLARHGRRHDHAGAPRGPDDVAQGRRSVHERRRGRENVRRPDQHLHRHDGHGDRHVERRVREVHRHG